MTTNNISNEIHGAAPLCLFDILSTQQDAEEWANLLDDFLGPETDVYTRLLERAGPNKQRVKLSS